LPTREAIKIASDQDLDLVEVAPNTVPPVCKIMDYGKYRYQQSKKHTKQKTIVLKEVRVRPQINEHDLQFKMKSIQKFLEQGNKAKVTMLFRAVRSFILLMQKICSSELPKSFLIYQL